MITRDYVGIVATTAMSSPSAPAIAVHIDSVGECAFAPVFRLVSPCSDYLAQPLISHRFGFLCIDPFLFRLSAPFLQQAQPLRMEPKTS